MTATLPKLLDRKTLAAELGITPAQAESVMRRCPKLRIGRQVFVDRADVRAYLQSVKVNAEGYAHG